jgi:large repetitive protein
MVAVFTGQGLGFFQSSITQLGQGVGSALGQSRGGQLINLATGNVVLRDTDENLLVRGLNSSFVRTYNSRGSLSGVGQDAWITGYERSVVLDAKLNDDGSWNQKESTVRLILGDGEEAVFTHSADNTYRSTAGDGAHDLLTWDSRKSRWYFVEGGTNRREVYDALQGGRLVQISDLASGASANILYDANGRVVEAQSVDGAGVNADALLFSYNAAGQLTALSTRENGLIKGQVSYEYDNFGRLSSVTTDLTPEVSSDNVWNSTASINDGKLFRTSYTYVTASASDLRIASVTTGDGAAVAYTYESDGAGGFRVKTMTEGSASDGSAQTITFTYRIGATDVADAAGRTWTYEYDAAKQLTATLEPAVNGLRQKTSYTYDANGNIIRSRQEAFSGAAPALDVVYQYDGNGNRTLQRDLQGNTVAWTYSAANLITSEIRYTVADVDGLDPAHSGTVNVPSGALTTRYIYDAQNRIRFVINAAGEVAEMAYAMSGNGAGRLAAERRYLGASYTGAYTEAALSTWASDTTANRRALSSLTTYAYDVKGRLQQTADYATVTADALGNGVLDSATSITNFTYDAQGLLRQKIVVHGAGRSLSAVGLGSEVSDFIYDGLGRLLSVLSRDSSNAGATDAQTLLNTYAYIDSANQIRVSLDSGVIRTEARNKAGDVVSVSEQATINGAPVTRITQRVYDAAGLLRADQDAAGALRYYFYDTAGRLEATVDGVGAVQRIIYDNLGRVQSTVQYANRVDTSAWLVGNTVVKNSILFLWSPPSESPTLRSAEPIGRRPREVILSANQAWVLIGGDDRSASKTYDASGRLITETNSVGLIIRYAYDAANRLESVTRTDSNSNSQRVDRMFYDDAGRLIATLDAEGYISESVYDQGGRLVKTIRYATLTSSTFWTNGSLSQLRPVTSNADQVTRYFYNARNQQIGLLNAEGYLTEYVYDEAANQRIIKAYSKKPFFVSEPTFVYLRSNAMENPPAEAFRLTQRSFNGLGQLVTELNHEGAVTRYTYDEVGRLVKTESAQGTSEVRENNRRYDVFGNLIGELSGEGSTRLLSGMTEAQLDAVYAQYGVRHNYDLLGRRTESVDAEGNKSWYFYDREGRQTFSVRGVTDANGVKNAQAEVTEMRYSAFGQVTESLAYTGRVNIAVPGLRSSVEAAISTLSFVVSQDSRVYAYYDRGGRLTTTVDAEGYQSELRYNAFGDTTSKVKWSENWQEITTQYQYDRRGLRVGEVESYIEDFENHLAGLDPSRSANWQYDAFGRVVQSTDARGVISNYAYDRLGRKVTQIVNNVSGRNEAHSIGYDAFDRVVTTTDSLNKITNYSYSDANRSLTVTTPEGVAVTTVHNAFGQTLQVRQALPGGITAVSGLEYNKDGQLIRSTDASGAASQNHYDARGLLDETIDATGRKVQLSYDAVGRMLTRVEDPGAGKLNLTTRYEYDAQGRQIKVTDASGRTTSMAYDTKGQLIEVVQDPNGLALRTTYTWNHDGQQLSVTEGAGSASARTVDYVYDGFGRRILENIAGLVTTYAYDANDNLVLRTDASGRVTRYVYDAANRLRFSIDNAGGVIETLFDAMGRATYTRAYVKTLNLSSIQGVAPSEGELVAWLNNQNLADDVNDVVSYRLYDADGRARLMIDGEGAVVEYQYDSAGRLNAEKRYAKAMVLDFPMRSALRNGSVGIPYVLGVTTPNAASDAVTHYRYDLQGRLVFTVDATGAVTRTFYDSAGRQTSSYRFAEAIDISQIGTIGINDFSWNGYDGESRIYDGAGRLRFTLSADGGVEEIRYDSASRVLTTLKYTVPNTALLLALSEELNAGTVTETDIATFVTAHQSTAQANHFVYDTAGRQRFQLVRISADKVSISETQYNQAGEAVLTRGFTQALTVDSALAVKLATGTASESDFISFIDVNAAQSNTQRRVFDSAGRLAFSVDSVGSVIRTQYDGVGNVTVTRRYASTINVANLSATTTDLQLLQMVTSSASDIVEYRFYDSAGRVAFTVHADGALEEIRYDAIGRSISSLSYSSKLNGQLLQNVATGVATTAQLNEFAISNESTARLQRTVYDAANRVRYQMVRSENNQNFVTETQYNAQGRITAKIQYGVAIAYVDNQNEADVASSIQAVLSTTPAIRAAQVRSTRFVHDAQGRERFVIDAGGSVTEKRYDGIGRVVEELAYADRPAATVTDFVAWSLSQTNSSTRRVVTEYDLVGQVSRKIDVYGNAENYEYDGAGQLIKYTNRLGAAWTYEYDLSGRRTKEVSPQVSVYSADHNLSFTRSIFVRVDYDALGNVVRRTDNAYTNEARVTEYIYDNRGNQIRTILPDAGQLNAAGALMFSGQTSSVDVSYNSLGQAVVEKDAIDNYRYKTYDTLGRIQYEVDQEGYVTSYSYNVFGEQVSVKRHATRLNTDVAAFSSVNWQAGQALNAVLIESGLVASAQDRTLETKYDALGQKIEVTQAALNYYANGSVAVGKPTTRFVYSNFGELVKESILLQGSPDAAGAVWSDSYRYYDALGRNVITVDALGYVTEQEYNAVGDVTRQTEYARALSIGTTQTLSIIAPPAMPVAGDAITGYDRTQLSAYDLLARKISTTVTRHSVNSSSGAVEQTQVSTQLAYDKEGNLISVQNGLGTTITSYDALGRVISIKEPERLVVSDAADAAITNNISANLNNIQFQRSPYTAMQYDAFGNMVKRHRYANGQIGNFAPTADAVNDQVHQVRYDLRGRVVSETNGGTRVYNAADQVVEVRNVISSGPPENITATTQYTYDKNGNQLTLQTARSRNVGSSSYIFSAETTENVRYNAFGEIIAKDDQLTNAFTNNDFAEYEYDSSGRMIRSNAQGGAWRSYAYNLAGQQVRELRKSYGLNAQGQAVLLDAETINVLDKLGRLQAQQLPGFSDNLDLRPLIQQQFDRWGNVVKVTDARGFETEYRYNDQNKVVLEIRPEVKVVNANGSELRIRPTISSFYDQYGRLTETRDANGNKRLHEYNSAGQEVRTTDALGNASSYAYDVFGQQRYAQNAQGYITYKKYDTLGRVTSHGDFTTHNSWNGQSNGRHKNQIEAYGLESMGDRWRVTNALQHSARYEYDSRHLLLNSHTAAGVSTGYKYDQQGRKARETFGNIDQWRYVLGLEDTNNIINLSLSTGPANNYNTGFEDEYGGYYQHQGSQYTSFSGPGVMKDRENEKVFLDEQTWDYDYFGRLIDHNDLGGADYNYTYQAETGQLIQMSRAAATKIDVRVYGLSYEGEVSAAGSTPVDPNVSLATNLGVTTPLTANDRQQFYYANGQLKEIREGSNWTRYAYDAAGNRTMEETYTRDGKNEVVHLRTTSSYDSQNRISLVTQKDMRWQSYTNNTAVRYSYDAAGNRRRVTAASGSYDISSNAPAINVTAFENQLFSLGNLANLFSDRIEADMRINVTMADGSALPAWLSSADINRYEFTPTEVANLNLKLTAVDTNDGTVFSRDININVLPSQPPIVNNIEAQTLNIGVAWSFEMSQAFSDPEGLGLSYLASPLPSWMSFDAATGKLSGTPIRSGVYQINLQVTDVDGQMVQQVLNVSVAPWEISANLNELVSFDQLYESFIRQNDETPISYTATLDSYTLFGPAGSTATPAVLNWFSIDNYGTLGGSPTRRGTYNILLEGTYANGEVRQRVLTVLVNFALAPHDTGDAGSGVTSPVFLDAGRGAAATASARIQPPQNTTDTLVDVIIDDGNIGGNGGLNNTGGNNGGGGNNNPTAPVGPGGSFAYFSSYGNKSFWYEYDAENRVTLVNGRMDNGQIKLGTLDQWSKDLSYTLAYDSAGREIQRGYLENGARKSEGTVYNERGQRSYTTLNTQTSTTTSVGEVSQSYIYNAAGQLTVRTEYFPAGSHDAGVDIANRIKRQESYVYDGDGRTASQSVSGYDVEGPWGVVSYTPKLEWQGGGVTTVQVPNYGWRALTTISTVTHNYNTNLGGRLESYTYNDVRKEWGSPANTVNGYWQTFNYSYDARDSYLEQRISGYGHNFQSGTSTSVYDGWGRRVAVHDSKTRVFAYDGEGNILQRREDGVNYGITSYAYVKGNQVAASNSGYLDVVSNLTAYRNSDSGSTTTTVQAGDTLQSIAQRVYGNSSLWYVLATANALSDGQALTAGTALKVPEVKVNSNDANTFKPYNPGDIVGNTSPSLDYISPPPPKKSCNVLATILIVIVVAIVTIYTAGAAAGAAGLVGSTTAGTATLGASVLAGGAGLTATAGSLAAAAGVAATSIGAAVIGAAAGAIAGQLVGMAFDSDKKFDWSAVAISGVTAGLTAGFGGAVFGVGKTVTAAGRLMAAGGWARAASSAVMSSFVSYGVNWVANRIDSSRDRDNEKFNWVGVAANVVGAVVSNRAGKWLKDSKLTNWLKNETTQGLVNDTATGFISNSVGLHTRKLLGSDEEVDYGKIAVDAFGNALGNVAVAQIDAGIKLLKQKKQDSIIDRIKFSEDIEENKYSNAVAKSIVSSGLEFDLNDANTREALIDAVNSYKVTDDPEHNILLYKNLLKYSQLTGRQIDQIAAAHRFALNPNYKLPSEMLEAKDVTSHQLKSDAALDKDTIQLDEVVVQATKQGYKHGETILTAPVDAGLIFVGKAAVAVGEFLQRNPMLEYALIGLDIAAGPQMFLIRKAFEASKLGKMVNDAIGKMSQSAAEMFANAGYNQRDSVAGTAGVVVGLGLIVAGAKYAIKNWTSVYKVVDRVAANAVKLQSKLTSFINKTLPSKSLSSGFLGKADDVIPEDPKFYTAVFQMKLDPSIFGKSRSVHFNRANKALDDALKSNPEFAAQMEELIPGIEKAVSSVGGRKNPEAWVWEHSSSSTAFGEMGIMKLVPQVQHTPGSIFWRIIHPDKGAAGGYSEWAIPFGAPKN